MGRVRLCNTTSVLFWLENGKVLGVANTPIAALLEGL